MRNMDKGYGLPSSGTCFQPRKTSGARGEALLQRDQDNDRDSGAALAIVLLVAGGLTLVSVLSVVLSSILASL